MKLNRYTLSQNTSGSPIVRMNTKHFTARVAFIITLLFCITTPNVSLYANASDLAIAAPDAPTQLTASAGDGSVDLNWVAPVIDGGSPITSYSIEVFDGISAGPATVAPLLGTATQTSARVIGLTNGVSYTFRVRAVNVDGPGAWSTGVIKTPVNIASTGTTWTSQSSPVGANNVWFSVAYGNGLFVAVSLDGTGNRVMTSPDGITWTSRTSAADNNWRAVTFGNGLFVAVAVTGTGNRVMTSPDGINWTIHTSAADNNWRSVTYGNGLFVAVSNTGAGNRVMTSPNGVTWTLQTSPSNEWNEVTYGNGLFVAVGSTGTGNRVMTSPDGINWTNQTSVADVAWESVTYGNGLFVAVSQNGTNRVMTSPDGITWTARNAAAANAWLNVTYGNGLFVAVSGSGSNDRVMTSPDGITWTSQVPADNNNWNSIAYGDGIFVAVSSTGADRVMRSINPIPFTPSQFTASAGAASVDLNWVAPENDGGSPITSYEVQRSTNGTIWSAATVAPSLGAVAPTSARVTGLANGTSYFFRVRAITGNGPLTWSNMVSGTPISTAGNGITWTSHTAALNIEWRSVAYGNGLFVAVAPTSNSNQIMTSPDGITWTLQASAVDNQWISVTYGNGLFVAVAQTGTGNRVMTSPDGETWTVRNSAADRSWTSVTFGNGIFVAVAQTGTGNRVMTSPDGITWTTRSSAADNLWTSVTYGNGLFVAVSWSGSGNRVMTSPDGITWTSSASAVDNEWRSVTYGNGLYVATASSGTNNRVMTSPDGITWTARTSAADIFWNSVTYGNGTFLAVATAGSGDRVMTSPDGINWTLRTPSENNQWFSVAYGNGAFVAVSNLGANRVMRSVVSAPGAPTELLASAGAGSVDLNWVAPASDGGSPITNYVVEQSSNGGGSWNPATVAASLGASNPTSARVTGLTDGTAYEFRVRAVNAAGTGPESGIASAIPISTAGKGIEWTTQNSAANYQWRSVTYGNGLFVAVAANGTGNRVMTSPDGINWTSSNSASDNLWTSVTYGNGLFVAVAQSGTGNRVMTSPDGVTWTNQTSAADYSWLSVTYGNGLFVAVATSGAERVMTSPDGFTWTSQTTPVDGDWYSVAYGNGLFVAVALSGSGSRVMTSPDGITWTSQAAAADNFWASVAYGNGLFVAVAAGGTGNHVMTSPDGVTWTSQTSAVDNQWLSVTYGNGLFVAVAANGTGNRVTTSPDGITWTTQTSAADNSWSSVTYGNGLFVAVSEDGSGTQVMRSAQTITPGAPTELLASAGAGSVDLNWVAPVSDGGMPITGYEVEQSTNGTTWDPATVAASLGASNPTSARVTGLTNGTIYLFRVRAININGSGPESSVASAMPVGTAGTGGNWAINNAIPNLPWNSVTYGNGQFVAVASGGISNRVMTSSDGALWSNQITTNNSWNSVTFGNGLFVAVATDGIGDRVMTSPDGETWTNQTSAADNQWRSVTYGNGLFVAVANTGTGNRVMTSTDGITWTSQTSAADNSWQSVTYGNGLFVAVAASGTGDRVMTSPDGIIWTSQTSAADNQWYSVTYGNGLFVAVANTGTGNRVMTSPDGITWTSQTSATDNNWLSVTYGNGYFVAVAQTGVGNRVMTSLNGTTWTSQESAADNNWSSVIYGNGLFISVAQSGSNNRVMLSALSVPDAPTELLASAGAGSVDLSWVAPAYNGGSPITGYAVEQSTDGAIWVPSTVAASLGASNPTSALVTGLSDGTAYQFRVRAVSAAGTGLESATASAIPISTAGTGVNWAIHNSTDDRLWTSVTYGNGLFVAVAQTGVGNRVMTSPDGIDWTSRPAATNNDWTSVTYGNGLFVAVSSTGSGNRVMTSPDGETWTNQTSAADIVWTSVTYGNGLFVAVATNGSGNQVMTSPDGVTWMIQTTPVSNQWNSVTYGNGLFVAVATGGDLQRVMTSPDGENWTPHTAPEKIWTSVTYGNGLFVAVASGGISLDNLVMTSPDGVTWTSQTSAANKALRDVTYGNGLFVAVTVDLGTGQRVMTSPDGENWTSQESAADNPWNSITYGNGAFVSVGGTSLGGGSKVMRSAFTPPGAPTELLASAGAGSVDLNWVAPANNGGSPITGYEVEQSTDGSIWDPATVAPSLGASNPTSARVSGLTDGTPYQFRVRAVNAIGSGPESGTASATPISTAGTGVSWTSHSASVNIQWRSVTYGNGIFVAVASTGTSNRVMTSPDGITWTIVTSAPDYLWNSVTFGNGLFVAVAFFDNVERVMTSPDGVVWTPRAALNLVWTSVTYGNGLFVAVSSDGANNQVMTSPNGVNWTSPTNPQASWSSVTYGNGLFVAVGDGVMMSPDGITWTSQTAAVNLQWNSVTYGNGLFVAVAGSGSGNRVMTSPDGVNWTSQTSAADNTWKSVTYGNGQFVAVAEDGSGNRVMTSPDGVNWTIQSSAANNLWRSVTYGNGAFVAVAGSGTGNRVMRSVLTGPPTTIAINDGDGQTADAGTAVFTAPSVLVTDANGIPVQGFEVLFEVASGGGTVDPTTAVMTNSSGIATVNTWTLGAIPGSNTLTATALGLTGSPVTFTATGEIGPASAATSTIIATPTSIVANGLTTSTIVMQLRDAAGNDLTDDSGANSVQFFTNAGTLTNLTNNLDGSFQVTLTSSLTAETATITGNVNTNPVVDNATVTFTDGSAVQQIYISNAQIVNKSVDGSIGALSIYLAPGVDAPGCGTFVMPCATLSYIFGSLSANDIVYVNGTIIESGYYNLTAGMSGVSIQGFGTTDPFDPTFAQIVFPDPPAGSTTAIDIPVGADGVRIEHIRLSFAGNSGFGNGILVNADANDVVFDNVVFQGTTAPDEAIRHAISDGSGANTGLSITNSLFTDQFASSVVVLNSGTGFSVSHNFFAQTHIGFDDDGDAVENPMAASVFIGRSQSVTVDVEYNRFNTAMADATVPANNDGPTTAVYIEGGWPLSAADDIRIQHNTFTMNGTGSTRNVHGIYFDIDPAADGGNGNFNAVNSLTGGFISVRDNVITGARDSNSGDASSYGLYVPIAFGPAFASYNIFFGNEDDSNNAIDVTTGPGNGNNISEDISGAAADPLLDFTNEFGYLA